MSAVAVIASDAAPELPIRKEGNQLGEHRTANIHAPF